MDVITRRRLPHWYVHGAIHFVTYRLHGTIPTQVLYRLREQRLQYTAQKPAAGMTPKEHRYLAHKQFFAAYDRYLDTHVTCDWLSRPSIASMIRENLFHHRGVKYELLSYCIMPNHVHVLLLPKVSYFEAETATSASFPPTLVVPAENWADDEKGDWGGPLAEIMHSLKSYSANRANKILSRKGKFWQHESYDHWVRDLDELERIVEYIALNPVKAGLVKKPHEWIYSSAYDRFCLDENLTGWLPPSEPIF